MFSFNTRVEETDECITVFVSGRFNADCTEDFLETIDSDQVNRPKKLCIDFREAESLDSSAIGCLLMVHEKSQKLGREAVLANTFGLVDAALKISNLNKLFTMAQ
ncbi:MAG TPA: STAS domain-containing protein [Rhodocyclaceae bacterium]|nr:STAS domain-containing protein [Rhodocyclaceae bacterium]